MIVRFSNSAWQDYLFWANSDAKTLRRINDLIEECRRAPFFGTGKPEPLRSNLKGWWSRRINREHRLFYRVSGKGKEQALEIAQVRFHY